MVVAALVENRLWSRCRSQRFRSYGTYIDDNEKNSIEENRRQEYASRLLPGVVIWIPDRISDAEKDDGGAHPFVVKEIQGEHVLAYLRTSRLKGNREGCIHMPADQMLGLERSGYIVVERGVTRLSLDDLIKNNCRVVGSVAPEYVQKIQEAEKQLALRKLKGKSVRS